MILVIKTILTIVLIVAMAFCVWCIIGDVKDGYKNWLRLTVSLLLTVIGMLDILILWFT